MRIRIDGVTEVIDIHYNKKESFHVKNFRQDILTWADSGHWNLSNAATENQLIGKIKEVVDIYHEKICNKRKVIIYCMYGTTNIRMNKVSDGSWQGTKPGMKGVRSMFNSESDGNSYGFAITFRLAWEVSKNGVDYMSIGMDGQPYGRDRKATDEFVIGWTEKRELAFKSIQDGLEKLAGKVATVLTDEDKVINLLESGVKLLS